MITICLVTSGNHSTIIHDGYVFFFSYLRSLPTTEQFTGYEQDKINFFNIELPFN